MRDRLALAWLAALFLAGDASAGDAYFEHAIAKSEQTLVRPPDAYGLVVTDTYTSPIIKNLGIDNVDRITERFSFYTKNGKVRYGLDRFDPRKPTEAPYLRHLSVTLEPEGETKAVDAVRGKRTLSTNIQSKGFSVGQEDNYSYAASKAENESRPNSQPFQILANPCLAPLKLTPVELRRLPVTALPDDGGNKVYEVRKKQNNEEIVVRLHFSPQRGDAIVKSEFGIARVSPSGNEEFVKRVTRAVEKWQTLPSGVLVPALFRLQREENGQIVMKLDRTIASPLIGEVDAAMFDIARLPEFRDPDAVVNIGELVEQARNMPPVTTDSNWSRIAFLALNVAVIVMIALYLVHRYRARISSAN